MTDYRVAVVGGGAVGKSAFTVRFVNGKFIEKYDPTIEDRYRKQLELEFAGQKAASCMLEVYDTAGQEEYRSLRDHHMSNAEGFLLLYSIDDPKSLKLAQDLILHINRLKEGEEKKSPIVLVANKKDLEGQRKVSFEDGKALADKNGLVLLEASAKTGENVQDAFVALAKALYKLNKPPVPDETKKHRCILV